MRTDGQTDGQTDMTKLKGAVRNLANAPKNDYRVHDVAIFIPSVSQSTIYVYLIMYVCHCATSRTVPRWIPGGVTGDFFRGTPNRTMCPEVDSASESEYQGKGGRCVWLTIYHPCSAETSRKSGALIYPEPLGPSRPVAGDLYFTLILCMYVYCLRIKHRVLALCLVV